MRSGLRSAALAAAVGLLVSALPANAQWESDSQTSPDGRNILVSKDFGSERWAIALNPNDGTITGNVFRLDGEPPQFLWCDRIGDDGVSVNPADLEVTIQCFGTNSCASSPCLATEWDLIGEVPVSGTFFLPARDPFVPFQEPGVYCSPAALSARLELGLPAFEIQSAGCNYVTVTQESRLSLEAGDSLWLRLQHYELTAPPNTEAYMGVQIGEHFIWGLRIPIPSDGTAYMNGLNGVPEDIVIDFDAPAGTPIYFHMHNHGQNNYNIFDLRRGTSDTSPTLIDHDDWEIASIGVPLPTLPFVPLP